MPETAAELWTVWVLSGALRPRDYDLDVADHVLNRLSAHGVNGPTGIADLMGLAGWTARDLVHALAPLVASFAGMQRDLLSMLQRAGAESGTGENLRITYEFAEGDVIDETLAAFRERVMRLERMTVLLQPWRLTREEIWNSPLRDHASSEWIEALLTMSGGVDDWRAWPFAVGFPDPPLTGDPRVDDRVRRILSLVRYALTRLAEIGQNIEEVRHRLYERGSEDETDSELREIAQAATDAWPLSMASAVYAWVEEIMTRSVSDEELSAIDTWLSGIEKDEPHRVTMDQLVEEMTDVLSLPTWGKRHELYSAWIATQIDRALSGRLHFVVQDGAIRFPFRATCLAHLDHPNGYVSLWCEVRSPATGKLGGGRKANIQPDYRFLRASDGATLAAVEVKQYKVAAPTRHATTMRDYLGALPGIPVLLVAHGPLGGGILDALAEIDRSRARLHPDVRVDRPHQAAAFRADIAALFPKPRRPTRIELRWAAQVNDLDLHVLLNETDASWRTKVTEHATLRGDEYAGGPEIVDLSPDIHDSLKVRVNVYSNSTLLEADPVVEFFHGDDVVLKAQPSDDLARSGDRWWEVADIDASGAVVLSPQSLVSDGGSE